MPPLKGEQWMQMHAGCIDDALGPHHVIEVAPTRDRLTNYARNLRVERVRSLRAGYESARRDLEASRAEHGHHLRLVGAALGVEVKPGDSLATMAKTIECVAAGTLRRSDELHRDLLREQRIVDALVARVREAQS